MPHLVEPFRDVSCEEAIGKLKEAHEFLVRCARTAIAAISRGEDHWGIETKRLRVALSSDDRAPSLLGKQDECFGEIINITATMERLISVLKWFSNHSNYRDLRVAACNPSTSDEAGENDLVLANSAGVVVVRCEVCDVTSSRADSNGKEKKDIANLDCEREVPLDGIDRFICTSTEFASALSSKKRKWEKMPFRYQQTFLEDGSRTCLLKIVRPTS